jgi:hypothetical protein
MLAIFSVATTVLKYQEGEALTLSVFSALTGVFPSGFLQVPTSNKDTFKGNAHTLPSCLPLPD